MVLVFRSQSLKTSITCSLESTIVLYIQGRSDNMGNVSQVSIFYFVLKLLYQINEYVCAKVDIMIVLEQDGVHKSL